MIGANYNVGNFLNNLSKKTKNFVVLNSLTRKDLNLEEFSKQNEEKYFDFGNGVSNMISAASGFSARTKTPIVFGYTDLLISRAYEQIRNDFCLNNANIKIVGVGTGFDNGLKGGAYQFFEEIGILRGLYNMKIICPSNLSDFYSMLEKSMFEFGPCYFSLGLRLEDELKKPGKVEAKPDISIISYGKFFEHCTELSEMLKEDGLNVDLVETPEIVPLNFDILKPIFDSRLVVILEGQNQNGLFAEISKYLVLNRISSNVKFIGMDGKFSESGKSFDLMKKFGLDLPSLYRKIKEFMV